MIIIPFGEYKNFKDCVLKNKDKDNPEGYCSQIHFNITGKWPNENYKESLQKMFLEMSLNQFMKNNSIEFPYGQCKKAAEYVSKTIDGFNIKLLHNVIFGLVQDHYVATDGQYIIDLTFPSYYRQFKKSILFDKFKNNVQWFEKNKNKTVFNGYDYLANIYGKR